MTTNCTGLRVLGLAGSPRRGGNSEALLDCALQGAHDAGAEVSKIVINDLDFSACQNCGFCSREGRCRLQDDMCRVYEALEAADHIILASPIYFATVSAQTKMMIDRCQPFWARKHVLKQSPGKIGRTGLFLCCGGFEKGQKLFDCAALPVRVWMHTIDVKPTNALFYPGVDPAGAIETHPTARDEALAAGRALVESGKMETG